MLQLLVDRTRGLSKGKLLAMLGVLTMVSPAAADEVSVAFAGLASNDGERWPPYILVTPLAVREESFAQAAPSSPGEVAPIPFEVGKGAEPEPWPYALPFLADRVIKQGYTLPLPRGVSLVYTYVERDVKITKVKLGIDGAPTGRDPLREPRFDQPCERCRGPL